MRHAKGYARTTQHPMISGLSGDAPKCLQIPINAVFPAVAAVGTWGSRTSDNDYSVESNRRSSSLLRVAS